MLKIETANNLLDNIKRASVEQLRRVPDKGIIRTMLLSDNTRALTLFLIVIDRYGEEALEWEAETIRHELSLDFSVGIPDTTLHKIMAAIAIVTTNFFYKDVNRFISICNVLDGDDLIPDEFNPADADEVLNGVTEAVLLWPPDEEDEFSPEIQEYIKQIFEVEGLNTPFNIMNAIRLPGKLMQIKEDYSSDPEMFSAIYKAQKDKLDDLMEDYYANMIELREQLRIVPISRGNKKKLLQDIDELINKLPVANKETPLK